MILGTCDATIVKIDNVITVTITNSVNFTADAGAVFVTLIPPRFRPSSSKQVPCMVINNGLTVIGSVIIAPNGNVFLLNGGVNSVSLVCGFPEGAVFSFTVFE